MDWINRKLTGVGFCLLWMILAGMILFGAVALAGGVWRKRLKPPVPIAS